jgi:hypothetical protein
VTLLRSRAAALAPLLAPVALALALAGSAAAKEGSGDTPPPFGENAPRTYESPQHFSLEIKFGPYSPNIDATSGLKAGSHPFAELFPPDPGKSRPPGRLLTQVEFDYQFMHKWYGSFAIGHTIGFYRRSTHSFEYLQQGGNDMVPCTFGVNCTRSAGDTTSLNVIPLAIEGVYKFDYLAQRYRIPFVPYFKIGLGYYLWWIENGGGFLSIANYTYTDTNGVQHTDSGYGGTWGWVMNPGGAFLLDVIDPAAARVMDAELGINHSYLFCEFHYADISGFGARGKMNLSDTTLNAGLSFEF